MNRPGLLLGQLLLVYVLLECDSSAAGFSATLNYVLLLKSSFRWITTPRGLGIYAGVVSALLVCSRPGQRCCLQHVVRRGAYMQGLVLLPVNQLSMLR
jgi:hypothetical protein